MFIVVKIFSTTQLESANDATPSSFAPVAVLRFEANDQVMYVDLNCSQTHLIVLTLHNQAQQTLLIYDLETVSFNAESVSSTPQVITRKEHVSNGI